MAGTLELLANTHVCNNSIANAVIKMFYVHCDVTDPCVSTDHQVSWVSLHLSPWYTALRINESNIPAVQ